MLEVALWSAVRALEEQMILARRIVQRSRKTNRMRAALVFERRALEAERNSAVIRELLLIDKNDDIGEPVLEDTDLPLDDRGRVRCRTDLRVEGVEDAWAAGDCAAVPDLTGPPGAYTSPSAQHAVRQAKQLGDNIALVLAGRDPRAYAHKHAGSVASLGLHQGVAQVYGIKLRGFPAWFMHRTYHVSRVPTINRKARVILDWTLALFFKRDVVSLGALQHPREEFRDALPERTSRP